MRNYRWVVVGISFFAIIINYLDRSALSYAITPLETLFGLTNTDFGIIASAFGIGYLVMTVVGGVLVDRYGAHKIWAGSSFCWSAACALLALASGFWSLFALRLILGIAEGPNFPALTRVDTDWLPVSERARAIAIGLAAVPFASVLGAPLISILVTTVGWRWMFFILGMLGIIWAIVWLATFRDKPEESPHVLPEELNYIKSDLNAAQQANHSLTEQKITWRFMLTHPALLTNNYAFFVFGYMLFFCITWLPGYLEQTYHLKVHEAGLFLIAPWLTATILLLLGGVISDTVWKKTRSLRYARSYLIWISQALSAICLIPVLFHPSLQMALLCISLGIGCGMMPNSAFYAINADLARERVATSLGIMDCAFATAGIIAPLLTGWLSSIAGNFVSAFSLLIVLTFTSVIAIIFLQHPDKEHNTLARK